MKKVQQGFTLIELMIVVAIIGILAAVALPAYQDYTTRAKISEGLTLASSAKTSVAEHYMSRNSMPADNTAAGFDSPDTQYVDSIAISNGLITINYSSASGVVDGSADVLIVSAVTSGVGGSVDWKCGYTTTAGTTTVLRKYLPSNCR